MTKLQHYQQLQYEERIAIASFEAQCLSIRAMARILNRAASTISREILRNAPSGKYSCTFAQKRRNRRRVFCRAVPKLLAGSALLVQVCALRKQKWSPEQIAIHLQRHHPNDSHQRKFSDTTRNHLQRHLRHAQRRAAQRPDCADEINNRPRKTLNAHSPLEVYRNLLLNHHSAPDIIQ